MYQIVNTCVHDPFLDQDFSLHNRYSVEEFLLFSTEVADLTTSRVIRFCEQFFPEGDISLSTLAVLNHRSGFQDKGSHITGDLDIVRHSIGKDIPNYIPDVSHQLDMSDVHFERLGFCVTTFLQHIIDFSDFEDGVGRTVYNDRESPVGIDEILHLTRSSYI